MTRIFSLAAFVLTLAACGSIEPLPGQYAITSATVGVDTCELGGEADIEEEVITLAIDEDAVTVSIGDSDGVTFDCEMDKSDLVCEEVVQTQDAGGDDGDAMLTLAWSLGGTFADESTLDPGELSLNYSCEGADCDLFAADAEITLPCQTAFTITAAQ